MNLNIEIGIVLKLIFFQTETASAFFEMMEPHRLIRVIGIKDKFYFHIAIMPLIASLAKRKSFNFYAKYLSVSLTVGMYSQRVHLNDFASNVARGVIFLITRPNRAMVDRKHHSARSPNVHARQLHITAKRDVF